VIVFHARRLDARAESGIRLRMAQEQCEQFGPQPVATFGGERVKGEKRSKR
jgi:hypothetical protein